MLREWNEACVYAGECLPPFFYDLSREPWLAIIAIAIGCFLIWAINEKVLDKRS